MIARELLSVHQPSHRGSLGNTDRHDSELDCWMPAAPDSSARMSLATSERSLLS